MSRHSGSIVGNFTNPAGGLESVAKFGWYSLRATGEIKFISEHWEQIFCSGIILLRPKFG
jgi:hypothetical protein